MSRERIVTRQLLPDDNQVDTIRPVSIDEYIGQERVIENIKISVKAALMRKEPLDHVLFYGPPGLGKTTLAKIIAHEMDVKIISSSGPALEKAHDLVGILTNLNYGDIFFIDEIHRLNRVVEEFLYPAMEDFQIDFVIDKGPYAKTIKLDLKRFTLVGATTRKGLITAPLRDRFGILHHLDFYSVEELEKIVFRASRILNIEIDDAGAGEIALRSRGTPRIANRLLHRVRDYSQVMGSGKITQEIADTALKLQGVDKKGLDTLDRAFLEVIIDVYNGGPVGIEAIAATLNEEKDTLEDTVEPFLLKTGFLLRTPSGRRASPAAYEHLGRSPKITGEQGDFFGFPEKNEI
ncbi:MAG TPA: Holliday junction branch migration DNA helicase RuvB [Candidatus Eremiobacteraeota bacterium]|nr:MAG: Holliday junction ATP-dependent DNA helicase RuvB [bacterium ADurb.Bin363]HPZ07525.1 Holliday junction branch migration DNA helicase RuvB [Candidatus Eremiobacteraeota bacterium]